MKTESMEGNELNENNVSSGASVASTQKLCFDSLDVEEANFN
jgi:hypothetical protein